ncbi:hypothetical protein [Bremerella sp.]|uniref:hypothetical protein n=1 Tax=Bremerella sp. TaxID=2795602 RepID=UPI00391C4DE8
MLNYILLLFAIVAALIVVAVAIDHFPGRHRRRRRSGTHWDTPFIIDHHSSDHDHNVTDGDGDEGWFDGGDIDIGD